MDIFDFIIESKDVGVRKPDFDFYKISLEVTNANPKNSTNFYSNTVDMENVAAEDIDISRGQAEFLKSLMKYIRIGELTPMKLRQVMNRNIDTKHFVNENWGDEEHFISLALDEKNSKPNSF